MLNRHLLLQPLYDDENETFSSYLIQYYQSNPLPKQLLLPNIEALSSLKELFDCKVLFPIKGDKKKLIDLAIENSKINLKQKFDIISKDRNSFENAVNQLVDLLDWPTDRIELFDNSNLFGSFNVSGMVVFIDGKPAKSEYRKFKITNDVNDDYGTMKEVIYRRYFRVLKDKLERPDLIIVDGGLGQVNVCEEIINSLNMNIPVAGLKNDDRHSTNMLITSDREIVLDKKSNLFLLLTRMQDEVHNYTISYHKNLRSKGALASILDNVPGVGEVRRNKLLKKYKTIDNMKNASIEELSEILPSEIAKEFREYLLNNS